MTNEARKERPVTVLGTQYHVRTTFKAISRIESLLGRSMFVISKELSNTTLPMTSIALMAHHVLATDEDKRAPTADEIGESMVDEGPAKVMGVCIWFAAQSFTGNTNRPKKAATPGEDQSET